MNYMSMHARLCDRDDQLAVLRAALDQRNNMIADLNKQNDVLRAKYEQLENRYLRDTAAAGRVVDMLSDKVRELRSENEQLSASHIARRNIQTLDQKEGFAS